MSETSIPDGPEGDDLRFARNMVVLREQRAMSQADLVRALQERGWSSVYQTTVSRIEKGERPVRYGEARAIARAFGVTAEQMLMAPADSKEAGHLSIARTRLLERHRELREAVTAWWKAHDALGEVVERVLGTGVQPTELPDDPDDVLVPATIADELALAKQTHDNVTPDSALRTGKVFYDYMIRRDDKR